MTCRFSPRMHTHRRMVRSAVNDALARARLTVALVVTARLWCALEVPLAQARVVGEGRRLLSENRSFAPPADYCYSCGSTLSAGYYHTCGIEANGTMQCWGSNDDNQTNIPKQYIRFSALHVNGTQSRRTWSTLYNWHKSVIDPATGDLVLFNFSDPALGFTVEDGGLDTWNDVPGWSAVGCGYSHTCGITTDGVLLCWGRGKNQQSLVPQWVMAASDVTWRQVSCGAGHTCAITANGSAACWGANDEGQLEIPASVDSWIDISCGYAHTCGVASTGQGFCWGWNGMTASTTTPYGQSQVPANLTWRHISAGFIHSCGVDIVGAGHCWGAGDSGQLEVPSVFETADSQTEITTPYDHAPQYEPARWKIITASYFHSCGLTISGSVFCWGNNDATQLDVPAATTNKIRVLASGFVHNCVTILTSVPDAATNVSSNVGQGICWGPTPQGAKSYWFVGQTTVPDPLSGNWTIPPT